MPKTLKGVALKANKPSDKNKLLKAIVHANKKSIEEAKAERDQLKLGKGSKKKCLLRNVPVIILLSYFMSFSYLKIFGTF